jgi:hypothetical protein
MKGQTPGQNTVLKKWNTILERLVTGKLGTKLDGPFIAASSAEGFFYGIKQLYYNAAALRSLDRLVVKSDPGLSLGGSFSNLYRNVISSTDYVFSTAYTRALQEEQKAQDTLVAPIVEAYRHFGMPGLKTQPTIIDIIKAIKEYL